MNSFLEFQKRWDNFSKSRAFIPFKKGRTDEEIKEEFEKISHTRSNLWNLKDYQVAEELFFKDRIREKDCAAFAYNNTTSNYNASTIYLGTKKYIACEGPREKDVPHFLDLLKATQTSYLVRLTPAYEGGLEKCYPYWEKLENSTSEFLCLKDAKIRLLVMEDWKDRQGINPQKLLKAVLQAKKEAKDGTITVHCSAGVGRTGTFLAALALLEKFNHPFSIEEIVYRLSLQRRKSVGAPDQYLTLYRLAELYSASFL